MADADDDLWPPERAEDYRAQVLARHRGTAFEALMEKRLAAWTRPYEDALAEEKERGA